MIKKELVKLNKEEQEKKKIKEENFTKEKIDIVKKVFEYCKGHYGLDDYTIDIIESKIRSSKYTTSLNVAHRIEIVNYKEQFIINLNEKPIETFYNENKIIEKLGIMEQKDIILSRLIFTCLHEIGHYMNNIKVSIKNKNITENELLDYKLYNNILRKKLYTNFLEKDLKINTDIIRLLYKYNNSETPADNFAYSVFPQVLKACDIRTSYFDIKKSKGKQRIDNKKLRKAIEEYFEIKIPKFLMNVDKVQINDKNNLNLNTKRYIDYILQSDNDYFVARKIIQLLTFYGYGILESYINDETKNSLLADYLVIIGRINIMISPKYLKYIEKDWIEMGARNVAFTEFPDVWRYLQEQDLI